MTDKERLQNIMETCKGNSLEDFIFSYIAKYTETLSTERIFNISYGLTHAFVCKEKKELITTKNLHRLVQCNTNGYKNISGKSIVCMCGCDSFHYEYDFRTSKVYMVCNSCEKDVVYVSNEFSSVLINSNMWVPKIIYARCHDCKYLDKNIWNCTLKSKSMNNKLEDKYVKEPVC